MDAFRDVEDEPCYVISIAARMAEVHHQTLRYYERVGLVVPLRSQGRHRLYSQRDVQKLRRIKALTEGMGLNLAGAEVALKLIDKIAAMEHEMKGIVKELNTLRSQINSEIQEG